LYLAESASVPGYSFRRGFRRRGKHRRLAAVGQSPRRPFARAAAVAALVHLGALAGLASLTCSCDALIGTEDRYFADDAAMAAPDATATDAATDSATGSRDANAADAGADAADTGPTVSTYAAVVAADGPVAWWRFEDPAISTIALNDVDGGPAAAATGTGVTFGVAGVVGSAVSFDGNGYLDVGNHYDLVGFTPFSFEAWVKAGWKDFENLILKRDSNGNGYVLYLRTGPQAQFEEQFGDAGDAVVWEDPVSTGDFVHVVVTYDPSVGVMMYLNGVGSLMSDTFTLDGGVPAPVATTLHLGDSLSGTLDEVALYDHALDVTRISAHYQAGIAGK
jgi:hypothetical protein